MNNRVLVTGSAGFLGRSVCRELVSHGYEVVCFDISEGLDILDGELFRSKLDGCHACVHLAAVADLYVAEENQPHCKLLNVGGTQVVAQACYELGVRLYYASTCCVYGNNGSVVSDERAKAAPTELYAETKLEGESVVEESGADYSILRLATFYGPEMRTSLATYVFLSKAILNETIYIHGDGTQTRCYTHVDDIASGIRVVLQEENQPKLINVSSEEEISVNELVGLVSEITGNKLYTEHVADREGQIFHSKISSMQLRDLGWSQKHDIRSGMRECYEFLHSQLVQERA